MKVRKGRLRLSPNEEAQLIKEETEKRRKLRLQQVREQSKENAAKIRHKVKEEKHKMLMKLATDIKDQLEAEKAERVRHLEQQYDNSLRNIGLGHKQASKQPDWSEELELIRQAENLRAEARGRSAFMKQQEDMAKKHQKEQKIIIARQQALAAEKLRAADIASLPPPPPDPLRNITMAKTKPVKVTDMNTFSTTHYHLQNEHAVDKADPQQQENAKAAAELEEERIRERALELKRLQEDQRERARLRHNEALKKELLKHDYDNILHDLSDLQRADWERRLKIVHNIPKQVYEPPNARMEDRQERQRNLEEEFENMYMAGTNHHGDISMALDPQPRPMTPSQEASLDVTGTDLSGTPLQEPTLLGMPPVLRDMTNTQKPAKQPEKVLRSLMDRIKSQREEWVNSHSVLEVGEALLPGKPRATLSQGKETHTPVLNGGNHQFVPMVPDPSPYDVQTNGPSAHKQARVMPPAQPRAPSPVAVMTTTVGSLPGTMTSAAQSRKSAMPPQQFASKLKASNDRQQTNVQFDPQPSVATLLTESDLTNILKEQENILEQKRLLELKLQQLTYEQHKVQLANRINTSQGQAQMPQQFSHIPSSVSQAPRPVLPQQTNIAISSAQPNLATVSMATYHATQQPEVIGQHALIAGSHLASSLSSSGMSQHPMNSIPPTHTTGSIPITTYQGQGYNGYQGQGQPARSAYQPTSAVLTTDQLMTHSGQQPIMQNGHVPVAMQPRPVSQQQGQGQSAVVSPGHIPPATLTSNGMSEQMRKVKEYQEHLLARHQQSKLVLEETKAEIRERRENLLKRYPNLDLSTLEGLGAKHLAPQHDESVSKSTNQGPPSSVASLLATLAKHPYYAATLGEPVSAATSSQVPSTSASTVQHAQMNGIGPHLTIDSETNLRKNKIDSIRKSLPFDADESLRYQEGYGGKNHNLDTTAGTDITETDTSSLTEKGSPSLKLGQKSIRGTERDAHMREMLLDSTEESGLDTTNTSASFLSEKEDAASIRQEELRLQLAKIQHQKEEIIRRHQQGQEKLQSKEEELKARLAALAPEDLARQLRESVRQQQVQIEAPVSSEHDSFTEDRRQLALSTILEVDTPTSARPTPAASTRPTYDAPIPTTRSSHDLPVPSTSKRSSHSTAHGAPVADYSGKNIDDVLERAKRFETEVLEKLRKQTSTVLFDNEFDDSLEFSVSRRENQTSQPLSTGSLTDDSLSTGPLDDSAPSHTKSGNGSFQTSKSWATELSQYNIPPSNQQNLPFKLLPADEANMKTAGGAKPSPKPVPAPRQEGSLFSGQENRFKVYSQINNDSDTSATSLSESGPIDVSDSIAADSINKEDMMRKLESLQQQLRKGEDQRQLLARQLLQQQQQSQMSESRTDNSTTTSHQDHFISRPFMPANTTNQSQLSQHSFTDQSTDSSASSNQSNARIDVDRPDFRPSGRMSPIGRSSKEEPTKVLTNGKAEIDSEYSFALADSSKQHRSTSTPGEERQKSAFDRTTASELPSSITVGDKSVMNHRKPTASVSWDVSEDLSNRRSFQTLSPERDGGSSTQDLTQASIKTAEQDLEEAKEEFRKFEREPFTMKSDQVRTFAVSRDGDLISEHSDSDKSSARNGQGMMADLTNYSLPSQNSNERHAMDLQRLSTHTLPETTTESRLSEISHRGSEQSESDSNPKSSSFTNVTTDASLNATGTSVLSQYTLNDSKPDNSNRSAATVDSTTDQDYIQDRFASLDNLISESKHLIARHKQVIEKTKSISPELPELPKQPPPTLNKRTNDDSPIPSSTIIDAKTLYSSAKSRADDSSLLSRETSSTKTLESSNQSGTVDENSLEYLVEHSSGITDEPPPDFTTLGSEISLSETCNKIEPFSDSTDSLQSFEKHEISESVNTQTTDDSMRDTTHSETSKSDSLQQIIEARKHNFMIRTEQRAAAAKDRALAQFQTKDSLQTVFRAVPVNVVSEPTLSMAVNSSNAEKSKPSSLNPVSSTIRRPVTDAKKTFEAKETEPAARISTIEPIKTSRSVSDAKRSFEAKEKEVKTSLVTPASPKPLNRALQPRGWDSSKLREPRESGTVPSESRSKIQRSSSVPADDHASRGRLVGEIQQFGGSGGFSQRQTSPSPTRKTPPKVMPKPVKPKPAETTQTAKPVSALSKTLSSWKKSRAVSAPSGSNWGKSSEKPENSIQVLPKEAPRALTEEERQQRAKDEQYERKIRLQHRLDSADEDLDTTASSTTSPTQDKPRKDFLGNLRSSKR